MVYNMVIKNIKGETLYENTKKHTIKGVVEEAIKRGVNLSCAELSGANLRNANLHNASLCNASLHNADLRNADLRNAYLFGAHLSGADLRYVNLSNADLSDADLRNAIISDADLNGACLFNAKNVPYIPMACPETGDFIGWKKIVETKEFYYTHFIVKLLIPEDAKRCSATTNKCRCDKAKVLEITNINTGKTVNVITNVKYEPCVYKVGKMVYPDSFDKDRWNECSHGIHFFVNEEDAWNY